MEWWNNYIDSQCVTALLKSVNPAGSVFSQLHHKTQYNLVLLLCTYITPTPNHYEVVAQTLQSIASIWVLICWQQNNYIKVTMKTLLSLIVKAVTAWHIIPLNHCRIKKTYPMTGINQWRRGPIALKGKSQGRHNPETGKCSRLSKYK